jgi:hypothetical protein
MEVSSERCDSHGRAIPKGAPEKDFVFQLPPILALAELREDRVHPGPIAAPRLVAPAERRGEPILVYGPRVQKTLDDRERHLGIVGPGCDPVRLKGRSGQTRDVESLTLKASTQRVADGQADERLTREAIRWGCRYECLFTATGLAGRPCSDCRCES